jgi:hypothetical protein
MSDPRKRPNVTTSTSTKRSRSSVPPVPVEPKNGDVKESKVASSSPSANIFTYSFNLRCEALDGDPRPPQKLLITNQYTWWQFHAAIRAKCYLEPLHVHSIAHSSLLSHGANLSAWSFLS